MDANTGPTLDTNTRLEIWIQCVVEVLSLVRSTGPPSVGIKIVGPNQARIYVCTSQVSEQAHRA